MKITIELEIDVEDRHEFLVAFAKFFEHNELALTFHKLKADEQTLTVSNLREYLPNLRKSYN